MINLENIKDSAVAKANKLKNYIGKTEEELSDFSLEDQIAITNASGMGTIELTDDSLEASDLLGNALFSAVSEAFDDVWGIDCIIEQEVENNSDYFDYREVAAFHFVKYTDSDDLACYKTITAFKIADNKRLGIEKYTFKTIVSPDEGIDDMNELLKLVNSRDKALLKSTFTKISTQFDFQMGKRDYFGV